MDTTQQGLALHRELKRRSVLAGAITGLAAGGITLLAAPARAATTSYYIDPRAGDDASDGSQSSRAWKSLTRLNAAIAAGHVAAGSIVRLRRGRTHFGIIRPGTVRGLRYDSWGDEPEQPLVTAYKYVQSEGCWRRTGDTLWSVDLEAAAVGRTHHGYVSSWTTEIGFVKVDGVIHGDRKTAVTALVDDWQFVSSGSTLTVRCQQNPSAGGRRVWLAVAEAIVEGRSGAVIRDLELVGTGRNAVQTASSGGVRGFEVSSCRIGEAGGGWASDGLSRIGNGVQVWSGSEDVFVGGNTIVDCWDTAMTVQGPSRPTGPTWSNIEFTGNRTDRNMQTFEHWSTGTPDPSRESSCRVTATTAVGAGTSWSAAIRPDRAGKGTHLLFYADAVGARISLQGNTFTGATHSYLFANAGIPSGLTSDRNTIALAPATRLQWQRPERVAEHVVWTSSTGLERASVFHTAD